MFDGNAWNYTTLCKLFVLRIVIWQYNYDLNIIIIYLKQY